MRSLLMLLSLTAACARPPPGGATGGGDGTASGDVGGGDGTGGGTPVPDIVQLSVESGSTNVNPADGVLFEVRYPACAYFAGPCESGTPSSAELGTGFAAGASYFQGNDLQVADAAVRDQGSPRFSLVPSTALGPDAWYTLRFTPSPEYRLRLASRFGGDSVTFFSGSAPAVRYLLRPTVPMKTDVYVAFTEPVSVAHAAFYEGTTALDGCMILDGACTAAESSAFMFRFAQPPAQAPSVTRLVVSGRAVGRDFTLDYAISGWGPCSSDTDTECWRPPP